MVFNIFEKRIGMSMLKKGDFMKKAKKLISIFLTLILISFSVITANAQILIIDKDDLKSQCKIFRKKYITGYDVPNVGPYYAEESVSYMQQIINENYDLIERYENGEDITSEMFQDGYDKMVEAEELMYMDDKELELLIDLNKSQKNLDNYFDDEMWEEYQNAIIEAEAALESGNLKAIDEHYYEMLYQHNKLCVYNLTVGDVNGDGTFDVNDVTYFQKKLAKNTDDLNYSQILVSLVGGNGSELNPNIANATSMQKYIAGSLPEKSIYAVEQYKSYFDSGSYASSNFYRNELNERHRMENPGLYGD